MGEVVGDDATLKVTSSGKVKFRMAPGDLTGKKWFEVSGWVTLIGNISKTISRNWSKTEEVKIAVAPIGYVVVGYNTSLTLSGTAWISVKATFQFHLCVWKGKTFGFYGLCGDGDTDEGARFNSSWNKKVDYGANVAIEGSATAYVGIEMGPVAVALTPMVEGTLSIANSKCQAKLRYSIGLKLGPTVMYWINKALAAACLDTLDALKLNLLSKEDKWGIWCPTSLGGPLRGGLNVR